ncbi:MAG: tRNA uridine-5-carboxymethylaminomethyl(34) synthesis GTPase MnmE, partial [Lachnospiraceae bacterium]
SDLNTVVSIEDLENLCKDDKDHYVIIQTSMKDETGIDQLEDAIKKYFISGKIDFNHEANITNIRHKEALSDAYESLKLVKKSIEDEMPEDFLSIDLMNAYSSLGKIIGQEVEDDLVNEIFSKFCMGK